MMKWEHHELEDEYVVRLFEDLGFYLEFYQGVWRLGFYDIDHRCPMPGILTSFNTLEGIPAVEEVTELANKAIAEFLRSKANEFYKE